MKPRDDCAMRRIWRRPKSHPRDDLRHTLAVGLPIAALLFVALPVLFRLIH